MLPAPSVALPGAPPGAPPVAPTLLPTVATTRARRALRALERLLAVYGLAALVHAACFGVCEVVSGSMAPTLVGQGPGSPGNDWVLYERVTPGWLKPTRDALVLFRGEDGVTIVKRVAAFGGERVAVEDGELAIDGARRPRPAGVARYLPMGHLRPRAGQAPWQVPAGELLVLGDDQRDSWDGRFFGGLAPARIEGRAVAVVWPPSRWRWLW